MLLILYSIFGVNLRNGGKMVRKKMVEKWIFNGFYFDKGCLIIIYIYSNIIYKKW